MSVLVVGTTYHSSASLLYVVVLYLPFPSWYRNCDKIDTAISELATTVVGSDVSGYMERSDSENWVYPVPGTVNQYKCKDRTYYYII